MIEFDHVTRTYGSKVAVSDLTLALDKMILTEAKRNNF